MNSFLMSHRLLDALLLGAIVVPITPFVALVVFLVKGKLRQRRAIQRLRSF